MAKRKRKSSTRQVKTGKYKDKSNDEIAEYALERLGVSSTVMDYAKELLFDRESSLGELLDDVSDFEQFYAPSDYVFKNALYYRGYVKGKNSAYELLLDAISKNSEQEIEFRKKIGYYTELDGVYAGERRRYLNHDFIDVLNDKELLEIYEEYNYRLNDKTKRDIRRRLNL